MDIRQIIEKKKAALELSDAEIRFFIEEYTRGEIPDYQAAALLMAVCLRGMTPMETAILTDAIANSGDTVDLSMLGERTVDKHSTGGVGDKTTLIVAPIVAAAGGLVAKMTGRGLGHTGGTADKLESISGYRVDIDSQQFLEQVKRIGIAVVAQNAVLAPADKKLYALRDVTATIDSIPLIASSIIGKKLASGARSIVLDVKCGSGSFMKTAEDAERLAEAMVDIGARCGRNISALITDMDSPLGYAVGNALEVREAVSVLRGKGCPRLTELCLALASEMLMLSLGLQKEAATAAASAALYEGHALRKFGEWISAQGGDTDFIENTDLLPSAAHALEFLADEDGFIWGTDTERVGYASLLLGAGRKTKEDTIDYAAGIIFHKRKGDFVKRGEAIATLYSSREELLAPALKELSSAISLSKSEPKKGALIYKVIRKSGC